MKISIITIIACLFGTFLLPAQSLQCVRPESLGVDSKRLCRVDTLIKQAIAQKEIPGAVLAVVYRDKMMYLKAFGNKQVYPSVAPMEDNTIFDLASLTKPVATAISAMILVERGQLRLSDRVDRYIPGFQGNISVQDLLTHSSGLPAYAPVDSLSKRKEKLSQDILMDYIAECPRRFEPQTKFQYSCLNFITLQRIVEHVSGQSLRDFAKTNIFDVLGMEHTDFCPPKEWLSLVAPTEKMSDGSVLRGVVHDPLARVLNQGVSGNAGLFSTAEDLAVLSIALLNDGAYDGKRILSPQGAKTMTTVPADVASYGRALGWDVSSDHASNQGDLLGPRTYGHTGYTGTSLVIDPDAGVAIILLTNRVHPHDTGSVGRLRATVANVVASAIGRNEKGMALKNNEVLVVKRKNSNQ